MLDEITAEGLASVRLNEARRCLQAAELVLSAGMFKDAANRSYYSIFHAMRTVEALDGFDSKQHDGVISYFRQQYIKTGIFPKLLSEIIADAREDRNQSDYMDYFVMSSAAAAAQIENAKTFLAAVEEYLSRAAPGALTANINLDDDDAAENNNGGGT